MKFVSETIVRSISRKTLLAQKASPEVLFGMGMVGLVGSTVLACRATLKVDEVLEEAKAKLDLARTFEHEDYSEHDRQKDISLIYVKTGVQTVKLYGPAIIVGAASIAALTTSHRILNNRNIALTAAYTALDKGFREYRSRVVAKYGDEQDRDFRYGTEKVEITDLETGKKKKVTRVTTGEPSIYARFFDSSAPAWDKYSPDTNLFYLKCQQNYANDLLKFRGHVFLNEVYDLLQLPRSKAGSVVGWIRSSNPGHGDNFVDFGIFSDSEQSHDFVNGYEGAILLDFNVDGIIYDKIDE